jgi:predicted outer membrane repeat protein
LRSVVASAVAGDTVDLSALSCSTLALATGEIDVGVGPLTIAGPGEMALTIDGAHQDRIFHAASGIDALTIRDLALMNGSTSGGDVDGGCVRADVLNLERVTLRNCVAGNGGFGYGGAVAAETVVAVSSAFSENSAIGIVDDAAGGAIAGTQSVTLTNCVVDGNVAQGHREAAGGAIFAPGILDIQSSVISNNQALATTIGAQGGAFFFHQASIVDSSIRGNGTDLLLGTGGAGSSTRDGQITILGSTISGNESTNGGGIYSGTVTLVNSTLSGNRAAGGTGGAIDAVTVNAYNSTVAFNYAWGSGGVRLAIAGAAQLQSTIIASNSVGFDVGTEDIGAAQAVTVVGANNLVMIAQDTVTLPVDTMSSDPLLAPLADNGGATQTHALAVTSPAVDVGNNSQGLLVDQRGPGFARTVGAAPDIGAFEIQAIEADRIFADGFD